MAKEFQTSNLTSIYLKIRLKLRWRVIHHSLKIKSELDSKGKSGEN